MATVVQNPVHRSPSSRLGEETPPTSAPPSFTPGTTHDDEPSTARSAAPVVVSVGLLFGLAVAAAFVGRGLVEMLTGLVAGS